MQPHQLSGRGESIGWRGRWIDIDRRLVYPRLLGALRGEIREADAGYVLGISDTLVFSNVKGSHLVPENVDVR